MVLQKNLILIRNIYSLPIDLKQNFQKQLNLKQANITIRPKLILDTLHIEKKRLLNQSTEIKQGDLTLNACRRRYELPSYHCHHALTDAQAAAELLLAQSHQISNGKEFKVGELT